LSSAGLTDLAPATVVTVTDKKLSFPHNLLNRKVHDRRFAAVLSNDQICASSGHPLIVVVPMTHSTDTQSETDVLISRTRSNGLETDSLAQLHLIQPLLKTDVIDKRGVLSNEDWESLIERLVWMTDRA
jgi:mRNA-degrading endonuclease toxin of MazEF toxin-antitoxin module